MQQSKSVQPCLCAMISAVCTCLYSNSTWHCISMRRLISCSATMLCDLKPSGSTSQNCRGWVVPSLWLAESSSLPYLSDLSCYVT